MPNGLQARFLTVPLHEDALTARTTASHVLCRDSLIHSDVPASQGRGRAAESERTKKVLELMDDSMHSSLTPTLERGGLS